MFSRCWPDASIKLLVQVRRLAPQHLARDDKKHVHITCAHFSQQGEVLASYNDEVSAFPEAPSHVWRSLSLDVHTQPLVMDLPHMLLFGSEMTQSELGNF